MSGLSAGPSRNLEKKDKRFVALMRPEDIRESILTTLDIAVTVEELRRPTSGLVEQLYTAFLQEIFDVDFDKYMINMQSQPYFSAVSV
jgi:Nuf2 family